MDKYSKAREKLVKFRLSDDEKQTLERLANGRGWTISMLLRYWIQQDGRVGAAEMPQVAGKLRSRTLPDDTPSIVPRPSPEIDDALGTPAAVVQAREHHIRCPCEKCVEKRGVAK